MLVKRDAFQAHPYHLVEPSPWPILVSFTLLVYTLGSAIYFNGYRFGFLTILFGLITTVTIMALWFRDISAEGTLGGHHTFLVQRGLNLGIVLFITSEVFFFIGLFWAFFHSALSPTVELGVHWPPLGIDPLNPFEVPLINTVILLASGSFITYAHHALISGNRKGVIIGTIITLILAGLFTTLQGYEYITAPFTIADSVYGSTFFLATGFHGAHIIIGTIFLTVGLFRTLSYHFTTTHHFGLEAAILYWHFVDVVWLFLYLAIYWWGS